MDWTEGQARRRKKSIPEEERSRSTAETDGGGMEAGTEAGKEEWNRECFRGLWSVKKVNSCPSSRNWKWCTEE